MQKGIKTLLEDRNHCTAPLLYDPTAEMQKGTTLRELIVNNEKLIVGTSHKD